MLNQRYPKKYLGPVLLLIAVAALIVSSCSSSGDDEVVPEGLVINELYAASGDDWIEIYNSLESPRDLSGYLIYDNPDTKYRIPDGVSVPAKGFLVLVCDDTGTGLNTNFRLSSSGETVFLENAGGTLIDRVTYPALGDGQSYGRYPDGSGVFAISGTITRGASNGDSQAPAVASVTRNPMVPGLNQTVTVTAQVVAGTPIASVKLWHRFNGGTYTAITMTGSAQSYTASLPASSLTGTREYYIEVTGSNGRTSFWPATAPGQVLNYILNTDPLPDLVINEFLAFNSSCCPDNSSGSAEFDDWIEIYNRGATAVNLAGMYLSDNKDNPFNFRIPSGNPAVTTIPPGGRLVLWADNTPSQGPLHLDFALNSLGEDVGLFYLDGRTIDVYTFGAQSENLSWGRTTDGAATWRIFNTPTPGQPNQ